MIRAGLGLVAGILLVAGAAAQAQSSAQAGAQASGQTSVQAGQQGAQASASGASAANASASSHQSGATLASGTAFNAALSAPVDSKKAKAGEQVMARTTESVKEHGRTVLPRGTRLIGHVTEASARANGDANSALAIQFDHAILKHGEEMPLDVTIQALASAQTAASLASDDVDAMGSTGAYAGGSGAAAGRGALGGVTSTAGGAVGAVTNTAANAGSLAGGTVDAAARTAAGASAASNGAVGGLNAAGQLMSNSRGVFGLNGTSLTSAASNDTQGSVITSAGKNVHLDSGTRMLLVAQAGPGAGSNQPAAKKDGEKARPKSERRTDHRRPSNE